MFEISIAFFSILEEIVGKSEITVNIDENSKVKDLIDILVLEFGKEFQENILDPNGDINKYVILGINGKDIRSIEGLNTPIHKDDDIVFLPAIAGG
jgi:molybdopterin synthase sulfur carrier subunit